MIRSFTWQRGESRPSAGDSGAVVEIPKDGWVWVDLADETPERITEVCGSFGVADRFVSDALAEASLPALEEHRDLVYVVLNTFRASEDGRLHASEIDLFIGVGFIISVHDGDIASTETLIERIGQGFELSAPSPAGLVAYLAMLGSKRFPPLIDGVEIALDSLEELAMSSNPRALNEVYALRRDLIVLRRVLGPQRQIYDELAEERSHPLIDEASRREFERVADYQSQVLESLDTARSLLGSVLETYRGAVADQTNEIVRVLTVFSAILLPLTLITGVYGMNFIDLPLADEPYGFWVTVGLMAILALGLWLYFSRRRFVGTPRLSDLPRAVGLGIYYVGTAPIRAVAGGIRLVTGAGGQNEPEAEDEG